MKYIRIALLLFLIEVLIALFINDKFIRPTVGDFLVVIFLYYLLKGVVNLSSLKIALIVIAFAFCVEFSQYLNLINHLGLEESNLAKLIFGNRFSWGDIMAYSLGIIFALFTDYLLIEKRSA